MRSDNADDAAVEARTQSGVLFRLLDPAFGFFVWIGHLILIYVAAAVACGLGLVTVDRDGQSGLVVALATVTIAAAALVGVHGVRRFGQRQAASDGGFLLSIAVGHDALAALAILWQLIPISMTPPCR